MPTLIRISLKNKLRMPESVTVANRQVDGINFKSSPATVMKGTWKRQCSIK